MFVRTSFEGSEPITRILSWLSHKGIGLVVNGHKMVPDYIFTYGMIWNFIETGMFLSPSSQIQTGEVEYSQSQNILFGPPSEQYLPHYARDMLRLFLRNQEVEEPKVLVASSSDYSKVDLIFSLESLGSPPQKEHSGLAQAIGWFLPPHYSIVLAEEKNLPPFVRL
jgi:hypothetical protein